LKYHKSGSVCTYIPDYAVSLARRPSFHDDTLSPGQVLSPFYLPTYHKIFATKFTNSSSLC